MLLRGAPPLGPPARGQWPLDPALGVRGNSVPSAAGGIQNTKMFPYNAKPYSTVSHLSKAA